MSNVLSIRSRQRTRRVNVRSLRQIILHLLQEQFAGCHYQLAVHLVTAREMARLNERFLRHHGSTDVITFDYSDGESTHAVHGEIFISLPDSVAQARAFNTTWQSELVRYVIHGLLHLRGYDDLEPARRRVMKREENRLLNRVGTRFKLVQLAASAPDSRKSRILNRPS